MLFLGKAEKPEYLEQESTMDPNFALMESCWGVPSPNPANMKTGSNMI